MFYLSSSPSFEAPEFLNTQLFAACFAKMNQRESNRCSLDVFAAVYELFVSASSSSPYTLTLTQHLQSPALAIFCSRTMWKHDKYPKRNSSHTQSASLPWKLPLTGLQRIFALLARYRLSHARLNCLVGRNLCQHCGLNISSRVK